MARHDFDFRLQFSHVLGDGGALPGQLISPWGWSMVTFSAAMI